MSKDFQSNIEMVYEYIASKFETPQAFLSSLSILDPYEGNIFQRRIGFRNKTIDGLNALFGLDEKFPQIISMEDFLKHPGLPFYSGTRLEPEEATKRIQQGSFRKLGERGIAMVTGMGYCFTPDFDTAAWYGRNGGVYAAKVRNNLDLAKSGDIDYVIAKASENFDSILDRKLSAIRSLADKKKTIISTLSGGKEYFCFAPDETKTALMQIYGFDGLESSPDNPRQHEICIYNREALLMTANPFVDEPIKS
jgi:hypothetical protein